MTLVAIMHPTHFGNIQLFQGCFKTGERRSQKNGNDTLYSLSHPSTNIFYLLSPTDHPFPSSKEGTQGQKRIKDERQANGGTPKSLQSTQKQKIKCTINLGYFFIFNSLTHRYPSRKTSLIVFFWQSPTEGGRWLDR